MKIRSRFVVFTLGAALLATLTGGCLTAPVRRPAVSAPATVAPSRPVQAPSSSSSSATGVQIGAEAVAAALAEVAEPPLLTDELLSSGDEAVLAAFAALEEWVANVVEAVDRYATGQSSRWIVNESGYAALHEALATRFTPAGADDQLGHYFEALAVDNGTGFIYMFRTTELRRALRLIDDGLTVDVRPQAVIISGRVADADLAGMYSHIDETFLLEPGPDGNYRVAGVAYNNR